MPEFNDMFFSFLDNGVYYSFRNLAVNVPFSPVICTQ